MKPLRGYHRAYRVPDSDKPETEVDLELEHHLELTTRELIERGMDPAAARREAERRFGDLHTLQRRCTRYERRWRRSLWGNEMMVTFWQDLRYTFRKMSKSPGFTAVALISLALGIGANTAIFSLANALLIRDLPFERAEELVDVYMDLPMFRNAPLSYPDYLDVRENTRDIFSDIGVATVTFGQTEQDGRIVSLLGEVVSGGYFPLLGIRASLGRTLLPEDDISRGAHYVVMLGHAYWQSAYGGDPGVLGRSIDISGDSYEIIGVAPEAYLGFFKGLRPDFFVSVQMMNVIAGSLGDQLAGRENNSFFARARLRPGVSLEQVGVTLNAIAEQQRLTYPNAWDETRSLRVVPTDQVIVNPSVDRVLVPAIFMAVGVVGLVLLIACANLASFLLARAADRKREIAVRLALGARRGTLIRQLLTETVVLALLGGAAGLGLGLWMVGFIPKLDLPLNLSIGLDLRLDATVLGLTAATTLCAGIFFGLAPAIQATNPDVAPTLKDESTGGGRPTRVTLRNFLVVGQVAASLVLLVSASLFLRSLEARRNTDPGFGHKPTAIVTFNLRSFESLGEGRVALQRIVEEVSALPDVRAVGIADNLPLDPTRIQTLDVNVDGVEPPPGTPAHEIDRSRVSPGFFEAMGIPIVLGRNFDVTIDRPGEQGVIIINQVMAERFWPGEDPLGRTVRTEAGTELLVVGVARSAKVRTLGEPPRPFMYLPVTQFYPTYPRLLAQTPGRAEDLMPRVVEVIRAADPEALLVSTETMEEHLSVMRLPDRLGALFSSSFALVALILATIGLYGVVSYAVASRSREMGIRMSLGADIRGVVGMMVGGGMKLVAIGGILGLTMAFLVSSVLQGFLFGVGALDPVAFVGVPALLLSVALVAAYVPARRASRVDPVRALRAE